MAEKVKCEVCGVMFKDEHGLAQHKSAKHPVVESGVKFNSKKIRNWTIFIVIVGFVIFGIVWLIYSTYSAINYCKVAPVTEVDIGGHTNLALHIHSKLIIIIDGKQQIIPANIGILPGIMRPIHTHATDNEIHIEGPCQRDFTIGEFFQIWNKPFSSECIIDKCTDSGILTMTVNGVLNTEFENYYMKDGDDIIIEYKSNA